MDDERIKVWEEKEHCSCNACHALNYKSKLLPELFEQTDRLISIQAGNVLFRLCPDCALKLVQMIEPEICDTI